MSFPDPQPPFMSSSAFPNSPMDPMGFWPSQIPTGTSNQNPHFDFLPTFKRPKISDDGSSQPSGSMNPGMIQPNPPINKPAGRMFYKTRVCYRFTKGGGCPNGDNCNFAHGEIELRQPPPNWEELVRQEGKGGGGNRDPSGIWDDNDDRVVQRMKICKKYYNGEECPYGERCNFIHKDPPQKSGEVLGRFRDNSRRESSAISIGTTTRPPVVQGSAADHFFNGNRVVDPCGDMSQGNLKPAFYKTRICAKWEMGVCPYGEKCHYAHGQAELQVYSNRVGESETVNATLVAARPVDVTNDEPTAEKRVPGAVAEEEGLGKKCLLKWNATKKINGIYADWIDDLPLPLPNNVEG